MCHLLGDNKILAAFRMYDADCEWVWVSTYWFFKVLLFKFYVSKSSHEVMSTILGFEDINFS